MDKSPEAFRTISEVADALETPAHVLRFWETRFPQIRPVKRAGGRRYYRPNDIALLTGIKYLLHAEGMTIRGVQKMLRDQGVRHVANLIGVDFKDTEDDAEAALSAALSANFEISAAPFAHISDDAHPAQATVVALQTALRRPENRPSNRSETRYERSASITPIDRSLVVDDAPCLPGLEPPPHKAAPNLSPNMPLAARLRALPKGCFANSPHARDILLRAQNLRAQQIQNPTTAAL